jgi:hypothetical protein
MTEHTKLSREIADELTATLTLTPTTTGGNCTALEGTLTDGTTILVTDGDASLPGTEDGDVYVWVGHYNADGDLMTDRGFFYGNEAPAYIYALALNADRSNP